MTRDVGRSGVFRELEEAFSDECEMRRKDDLPPDADTAFDTGPVRYHHVRRYVQDYLQERSQLAP
jgi:hypothetical protein